MAAQQAATLPGASGVPNGSAATAAAAAASSGSSAKHPKMSRTKNKHKKYPARLTNVDRSTAQTREVTVNSVTVVITEYKPKAAVAVTTVRRESTSEQSLSESNDSRS